VIGSLRSVGVAFTGVASLYQLPADPITLTLDATHLDLSRA